MKKVIIGFTFVMATMGVIFTILTIQKYNDEKENKSMEAKLQELEKKQKETEEKIKEKEKEKETIKQEKEESVKELESWEKRVKEIVDSLS